MRPPTSHCRWNAVRAALIALAIAGRAVAVPVPASSPTDELLQRGRELLALADQAQFTLTKVRMLEMAARTLPYWMVAEQMPILKKGEQLFFNPPTLSQANLELIRLLGAVPNVRDPELGISLMEEKVRIGLKVLALQEGDYRSGTEPKVEAAPSPLPRKDDMDLSVYRAWLVTGNHLFLNVPSLRDHVLEKIPVEARSECLLALVDSTTHVMEAERLVGTRERFLQIHQALLQRVDGQLQRTSSQLADFEVVTHGIGILTEHAHHLPGQQDLLGLLQKIVAKKGDLPIAQGVYEGPATLYKAAFLAREALVTDFGRHGAR